MSKRAQNVLGRICGVVGLILILLVVAVCLPLTAPHLAGYDVYAIVSGSMEPTIPTGSLIYAKAVEPATLESGDIVVFYGGQSSDTVITHRVVENNVADQELVTRGDANEDNDVSPIPYGHVIAQVAASVPVLGLFLPAISTTTGKLYLTGILAAAVLLRIVGARLTASRGSSHSEEETTETAPVEKKQKKRRKPNVPVIILILLLLGGMGYAGFRLGSILWGYYRDTTDYSDLAELVISTPAKKESERADDAEEDLDVPEPVEIEEAEEGVPISVDWDSLLAINSDIVGWLYQPGTVINYPVVQTTDNDYYLHRNLNGVSNSSGTLFVDANSMAGVIRSNYIIYGHHMKNGSMFASLDKYSDSSYYQDHPIMYYLTPTVNYRVDLIAAHIVESVEDNYPGYFSNLTEYENYLDEILSASIFKTHATVSTDYQLLTLSTCNYSNNYNDPRMQVHGLLIPID